MAQNKDKEIEFFSKHALFSDYNVFNTRTNLKIIEKFLILAQPKPGAYIADLGCGSGLFTHLLRKEGYSSCGIDLCPNLIALGKKKYQDLELRVGDVEDLPFEDNSLDAILLGGIIHHLPQPEKCAREVFRTLKPGGRFVAFDPNRRNPFMYLYRDRSSPFYSAEGVTENERPILAEELAHVFTQVGFRTETHFLSGLEYQYIASSLARVFLPIYNFLDQWLFKPNFLAPYRAFVFTTGEKR